MDIARLVIRYDVIRGRGCKGHITLFPKLDNLYLNT